MASLTSDQIQAFEAIRQRLSALSGNLNTLRNRIVTQQPSLANINASTSSVAENLKDLSEELSKHDQLLSHTLVFPNASFPAFTAPAVAENLLSTHLSLQVQEWIERGQQSAEEAAATSLISDSERQKLWHAAPGIAIQEAKKQKWGADYTLAEVQSGIQNVITGLRRELIVPEEDDDDDDMEEDEDDENENENEDEDDDEAMRVDAAHANTAVATGRAKVSSEAPPMDILDILYFSSMGKEINAATKRRIAPVKG